MLEDTVLAENAERIAALGLTVEQARSRGRFVLWLREPDVDAYDAVFRLSRDVEAAVLYARQEGRKEGRRDALKWACSPLPSLPPELDRVVEEFLERLNPDQNGGGT